MALETLKDVKEIGGYKVFSTLDPEALMTETEWDEYMKTHPIWIDHDKNEILFKIQNGPIKEVGVNGCQVDTLIHAAMQILKGLNEKFPSAYNDNAINKLEMAIWHLEQRTKDREKRGVEGTSND